MFVSKTTWRIPVTIRGAGRPQRLRVGLEASCPNPTRARTPAGACPSRRRERPIATTRRARRSGPRARGACFGVAVVSPTAAPVRRSVIVLPCRHAAAESQGTQQPISPDWPGLQNILPQWKAVFPTPARSEVLPRVDAPKQPRPRFQTPLVTACRDAGRLDRRPGPE